MKKILLILLAANLALAVVYFSPRAKPGIVEVDILNVGQGDAILITSGTNNILIDGGPGEAVLTELGEEMPITDRTIETIILTHPHDDHMQGLIEVMERFTVKRVIDTPMSEFTSGAYRTYAQTIAERQIERVSAKAGMRIELGQGFALHIWANDEESNNPNNDSVITYLTHADSCEILLMGDAAFAEEKELLAYKSDWQCEILKIGHHGSDTSTSDEWLAAVNPSLALISAGSGNSYGHPRQETLDKLQDIQILRTDLEGRIELYWDGKRFKYK